MSLEKKVKRRIIPIVLGCIILAGGAGLALALNQPQTISEQIAEKKFREDYNKALENYSRESYFSGQDEEFSGLNLREGEIPGMIKGRYVAFSQDKTSARYLDNKKLVSDTDLFQFVRMYSK